MDDMILEIRHLSKSFGSHEVLRDIDFTVKKGDVTSIIGASGSGKSTLLRCINLLETPTSGEILYPTYAKDALEYPYTVPEGCFFVLGDYRTQSEDSRDFGPVPLEDVQAKVITLLRRRSL